MARNDFPTMYASVCWSLLRQPEKSLSAFIQECHRRGVRFAPAAILMTADRVSYQRRQFMGRSGLLDADPVHITWGEVHALGEDNDALDVTDGGAHTIPAWLWSDFGHCLLLACDHWCGLLVPEDVEKAAAHYRALARQETDVSDQL